MNHKNWQILFGVILVALSVALYLVHFMIFHDAHHIFLYLLGDIAFVPIEVLLVTLIIHQLLSGREKRNMLDKLNMLIGAFFSETGSRLIVYFSDFDPKLTEIKNEFMISEGWTDRDFEQLIKRLRNYDYSIAAGFVDIISLRDFLKNKRDFLLRLIENPSLLEHEMFTQLLQAVFHLTEELSVRPTLENLPQKDLDHISGDINRVYVLLVKEWLSYMQHLKNNYPYLFSLALRTNPFDEEASAVIN